MYFCVNTLKIYLHLSSMNIEWFIVFYCSLFKKQPINFDHDNKTFCFWF